MMLEEVYAGAVFGFSTSAHTEKVLEVIAVDKVHGTVAVRWWEPGLCERTYDLSTFLSFPYDSFEESEL